jgi:electron transfer flavoprotein alpha subunit
MKTLVWVEHEAGAVKDATLATVTAASKLGEVHLLVAGQGVGAVAEAAAKIAGVARSMSLTTRPMPMRCRRMSRR